MSFSIAVSDSSDARPFIGQLGIKVDYISPIPTTPQECIEAFRGYQAVIALNEPFPREVLKALSPDLKIVARFGLGYDKVDVESAKEFGVCVTNAAGTMAGGVAETAFLLMLEAARHFVKYDAEMQNHIWKKEYCGVQLEGKTVGILGFGNIGRRLAQYLKGFGCKILVYDVFCQEAQLQKFDAKQVSLDELAAESDFISVHCPLVEETRHIVNESFLNKMKPAAILVNTSRGPTVDEEALADALMQKKIGGAGLDVFEAEPLPENSRLRGLDNVVLLPHIASFTKESMLECAMDVEQSILAVRDGKIPEHCLNAGFEVNRKD